MATSPFTPVAAQQYTRPADGPYGANPYIAQQANNIQAQSNQNLATNVMPGIGQGAQMAGQYGGSRQGVAQGVAAAQAQNGVNAAQANLYSSAYGQDQNYNVQNRGLDLQGQSMNNQYALGQSGLQLQNKSIDNSYNLGMGQLANSQQQASQNYDLGLRSNDLQYANLDSNIYQNNFQNQLAGANFGMNVQNQLQSNNALGLQAGTTMQNTPLSYYGQFANQANSIGQGYGTSTSQGQSSGSPLLGALGGAQLGGSLARNLGFGSSPAVVDGGYSIGQGSAYGGNRAGL